MWVVKQVLRAGDGGKRQRMRLEHTGQFGCAVACQALTQIGQEPIAGAHALVVGGQALVSSQIAKSECTAKRLPRPVAYHGQKNLLAILHFKHVVNGPG